MNHNDKYGNDWIIFQRLHTLCALCTYLSSHSSQFLRLIQVFCCHHSRQLLYRLDILGVKGRGRKDNLVFGLQTGFGRILKPTIYIYTDMHILQVV